MTDEPGESTMERVVTRVLGGRNKKLEELETLVRLLIKVVVALFVVDVMLALEVWDVIDVDIEAGANLPEFSYPHIIEHAQAIAALTVLGATVIGAFRGLRNQIAESDDRSS